MSNFQDNIASLIKESLAEQNAELQNEIKHIEWVLEQHADGTLCGFDKIMYGDRIEYLISYLEELKNRIK
jgi:hypothetical protein